MPLSRINSASIANNAVVAADIADGTLTAAKIISIANTQITGNIVSSQITSVANTQLTGTITGSQISSNTLSNTVFQTGSVENYMSAASLGFGMRNRIINGAMVIDQRNAGASVTINASSYTYPVDRFAGFGEPTDGVFTLQQSSTAPTGFTNSLVATVTTADSSIGATQRYFIRQAIEGYNVADMGFGASGASTFTLSFWTRSSLTGTFGGSLMNDNFDRAYPFTYTISSANTWEQKTITITGDTSGTWLKTNGGGLYVFWSIGAGSSRIGTAGAWQTPASPLFGATGQTNIIATNGATFYITGVQLEKGSTATSFDFRSYGTELALCQRYYVRVKPSGAGYPFQGAGIAFSTSNARLNIPFPVQMRAIPTSLEQSGTAGDYSVLQAAWVISTSVPIMAVASYTAITITFISTSGYTQYAGAVARDETGNAYLGWSAEL
jgi:hypothetical protein